MKRNKFYTVNKWNRPTFMPEKLFNLGGDTDSDSDSDSDTDSDSDSDSDSDDDIDVGDFGNSAWIPSGFKGASGIYGAVNSGLGMINTGEKRGLYDTLDPLHYLANGKTTGLGEGLGDAGVALTKTGIPIAMIGGAILKGAGDIVNAGWGTKLNEDLISNINSHVNQAKATGNAFGKAETSKDFFDTAGYLSGGVNFNNSDLGSTGWFRSNSKINNRANALRSDMSSALAYQTNAMTGAANRVDNNMDSELMRRYAAYGGPLNITVSLPQTTQSNDVHMGAIGLMQQDKYLDAINNRSSAIANKNQATPYMQAVGNLNAFGGELGTNGTDFTNGLLYIDAGGSHESNPLDGVPMGVDAEGIPNLVEEGETVYNDYVFSDRIKVPSFMYKELGLGGAITKKGNKKGISFADASKLLAQESEQRPNDPISQAGLEASLSKLADIQEAERMKDMAKEYTGLSGYACGGKMGRKYSGKDNHSQVLKRRTDSPNFWEEEENENVIEPERNLTPLEIIAQNKSTPERTIVVDNNGTSLRAINKAYPSTYRGVTEYTQPGYKDIEYDTDVPTYPTWMRYAPVIGSGIMSLTDALGLTNRPDYTYVNKIEAAADAAANADNNVDYTPIGNYLAYNPMDIWYEQNRLNANARAVDRALTNNGSPLGSRAAAILANSYNNQVASGELYRKALEYNDAKRQQVADFNRKTDMFNSQMGLEAAMANARYAQQARQMRLSGLAQASALRDAIDARVGAARAANLSNFLTSLGNIGRENFAMNQLNDIRAAHNGYYGTLSGRVRHEDHANGGKIRKRK